MRKRICAAILSVFMLLSLIVPAAAADAQFDFVLRVNGASKATVAIGETFTVQLMVTNNEIEDGATYNLYTIQDYVCYDQNLFSIDESSIHVMQLPPPGGDLFSASVVHFGGDTSDRVYTHRASTTGQNVKKTIEVLSFDLTAKKAGSDKISHDTPEIFTDVR